MKQADQDTAGYSFMVHNSHNTEVLLLFKCSSISCALSTDRLNSVKGCAGIRISLPVALAGTWSEGQQERLASVYDHDSMEEPG